MTALALDLERPEPPEAKRLADAFEAATRRVARQATTQLRDRAVTVVASADEAFHVNPDDLFRPEWWTDAVDVFILDVLTAEIVEAGAATAAEVGVAFDVVNPALERVATSHIEAIASWGQDMRTWVAGQVRRGMAEGLSVRNMAKALTDPGDSPLSPVRARLTAQTELIAGQNGANYATYTASGLTGVKRWMSTPDSRTRPSHVNAQGQERGLLDDFEVGGYHAPYPGASTLPAKERIACRCRLVFEPAEEQPDMAANLAASIQAFQTTNPDGSVTYQGAMVAARVPARYASTGPGALKPGELHITLQYLGNEAVYDPAAREIVTQRVGDLVEDHGPFEVLVNGWGVLGGDHALVVYVEAGELNDLHDQLAVQVPAPVGAGQHPGYVPHFTLGYGMTPDVSLNELVGDSFTVTEVLVAFGCTVHPDGRVEYGPGSQHLALDPEAVPPSPAKKTAKAAAETYSGLTVGFYNRDQPRAKDGKWGRGGPTVVAGENARGLPIVEGTADADAVDWPSTRGTPAEEASLERYQDEGGYAAINGALRSGGTADADAENITRLVDAHTIPEAVTAYRGVVGADLGLEEGGEFTDHGFVSTDTRGRHAVRIGKEGTSGHVTGTPTLLAIEVPAGAKGMYRRHVGESELLLQRGTRFHVVSRQPDQDGMAVWHLRVVDQPDLPSPSASTHTAAVTVAAAVTRRAAVRFGDWSDATVEWAATVEASGVTVGFAAPWEYQPRTGGRWQPDYVPPTVKIAQGQIAHPEHQNPVVIAVEHRAGVEHSAETARELADAGGEEVGSEAAG